MLKIFYKSKNKKSIFFKKTISIFLIILFLFTSTTTYITNTFANDNIFDNSIDFPINSDSAILLDVNSTVVLYKKNEKKKQIPHYLTKIMTAILVLEDFPDISQNFTFNYSAVMKDNNLNVEKLGSTPGDKLSIKDGLYSMFCTSANDVANALAEHCAGNIHDFVNLMNEKCIALGMKNTHFTNPTGIYEEGQYTTCEDMAILVSYALKNPTFVDMATVTTYTHAPIKRFQDPENVNNTLIQTNQLLRKSSKYYESNITSAVYGGTKNIGYNFSTSKNVNDMHLLLINMNAPTLKSGYEDVNKIFDAIYEKYRALIISEHDTSFPRDLGALKIGNIYLNLPESLTISKTATVTLPYNVKFEDLRKKVNFKEKLQNDVNSLGIVSYYYKNNLVGKASIEHFSTKDLTKVDISNLTSSGLIYRTNKKEVEKPNERNKYTSPIYRNAKGHIAISPSILKVCGIVILILLIIFGLLILRAKYIYKKRKEKYLKHINEQKNTNMQNTN